MRSLAALGEPGGALRHYEDLAKMLQEHLGASPAPETVALYESLRSREYVRDRAFLYSRLFFPPSLPISPPRQTACTFRQERHGVCV